ncbi:MAG: hypothetical protein JJU00_03285 [Opitutales bacterium]|nr:hypothetical protein [Opitutales bacterium]
MKKILLYTLGVSLGGTLAFGQTTVREYMHFDLVRDWDVNNQVTQVGGGNEVVGSGATALFESNFGQITGNTIGLAQFRTAVGNAFDAGLGGVIDFEDANRTLGSEPFNHPTAGTLERPNPAADQLRAGNIIIRRGERWWFEGSHAAPYRGKNTGAFDGTGPSGPDREEYSEVFFFEPQGGDQVLGERRLGLTTSFDLVFDPADMITTVGFAVLNWDNFQSFQDQNSDYPNIHAIASFTDGNTTVDQMSVGFTEQVASGNDYFFGFQGPDGFYLDSLLVYAIGNTTRVFIGVDDLGYVQIPEPATAATLAALLAAGLAVYIRRRRA